MLKVARKTVRRLATEIRGAEIAEAAAVLPLMFMMILGIFWFGQAFRIYGTITRAAQDGARAGAAPYCTTCSQSNTPAVNAANAVQATLTAAHLDPGQIVPLTQWTTPSLLGCTSGAAVSCTNPSNTNICVQTRVQLTPGGKPVCGISVSFEYPYKFWLPFSTLNQQGIQLQAVARVRTETP